MTNYGIPEWFRQENEKANIWNPLFDYSVVEVELSEFAAGLNNGWIESDVQTFLKSRPYLFDGLYRHGHGTYVFSELKFGSKYVADWVIGNGHSGGILWNLIELECPQSIPFLKNGHFAESARKGINQIRDWRAWITRNIAQVQNPRSQQGLGLYDLTGYAPGVVVVGRRALYSSADGCAGYNESRAAHRNENQIEVMSYESLIDKMRFHLERWKAQRAQPLSVEKAG